MQNYNEILPQSPPPLDCSPPLEALPCYRCGVLDRPAITPGASPHFAAARCQHCGHFIKWLSQYPAAERDDRRQQTRLQAMAQKPASPLQLAFLKSLGHTGPEPTNMREASERIDVLKRGRVV